MKNKWETNWNWLQHRNSSITRKIVSSTSNFFFTQEGPFPRCRKPLFQNEAKCKTFLVKMIFYYHANKTRFHKKGFALGPVFRERAFGTQTLTIADKRHDFSVFYYFLF